MRELQPKSAEPTAFFNAKVFRNAAITIGLSFVGGFVIGFLKSAGGMPVGTYVTLIGLSNLLSCVLGGLIAGLSVSKPVRVGHLQAVGLLVWLFGLINVPLGHNDIIGFFFSAIPVALCLALGGWIAGMLSDNKA
jgi:hypothetical protein